MDGPILLKLIHDCIDKQAEPCSALYRYIHYITSSIAGNYSSALAKEDIEDITQTVNFKLAHNGLKHFKGATKYEFLAYLKRITVNEIINFLHVKNDTLSYDVMEPESAASAAQDDPPESREMIQTVYEVLKDHTPDEQEAFSMYLNGSQYEEISQRFRSPVSTLATRFNVISKKIKERLEPPPKKQGDSVS